MRLIAIMLIAFSTWQIVQMAYLLNGYYFSHTAWLIYEMALPVYAFFIVGSIFVLRGNRFGRTLIVFSSASLIAAATFLQPAILTKVVSGFGSETSRIVLCISLAVFCSILIGGVLERQKESNEKLVVWRYHFRTLFMLSMFSAIHVNVYMYQRKIEKTAKCFFIQIEDAIQDGALTEQAFGLCQLVATQYPFTNPWNEVLYYLGMFGESESPEQRSRYLVEIIRFDDHRRDEVKLTMFDIHRFACMELSRIFEILGKIEKAKYYARLTEKYPMGSRACAFEYSMEENYLERRISELNAISIR